MLNWSQIVVHSSRYEIDDSTQVNRRHPCGSGAPATAIDSSKVSREKKSEVNEKRCFIDAKIRAASTGVSREKPQGCGAFFHLIFSAKQQKKTPPPLGLFTSLQPDFFL